jgi:uncharacterized RDD family membrane protein YckC
VERALEVRTAEAVALRYDLAGLGSRFLAVAIDLCVQSAVATGIVVAAASFSLPLAAALAWVRLDKAALVAAIALAALALFALFFGYFIAFELLWNGQTPGKRALGIRVVRDAGFPVDFGASVIRNVSRLLEFALGGYVIAAVIMLISRENKRPGDYAAGTIVVRDHAADIVSLDSLPRDDGDRGEGLEREDRVLIGRFLARSANLEPGARAAIAAQIAGRVRPKLRASFQHLDDLALLEHLGRPH